LLYINYIISNMNISFFGLNIYLTIKFKFIIFHLNFKTWHLNTIFLESRILFGGLIHWLLFLVDIMCNSILWIYYYYDSSYILCHLLELSIILIILFEKVHTSLIVLIWRNWFKSRFSRLNILRSNCRLLIL